MKAVILGVLLVISTCFNLVQWGVISRPPAEPPVLAGTYADREVYNTMYLACTKNGEYCYYQPWGMMEEGTYRLGAEDIYLLTPTDEAASVKTVVLKKGLLYLVEEDGTIIALPKIDTAAFYNGVSPSFFP